jgi:hypothetical protein
MKNNNEHKKDTNTWKFHGKEELQNLVKLIIKLFIIVGCVDRNKHFLYFFHGLRILNPHAIKHH